MHSILSQCIKARTEWQKTTAENTQTSGSW
jgi:hypothetical protein